MIQSQKQSRRFCNVKRIHGFKELFWPTQKTLKSLRFGSTLLLSGAPGAGKTTFALSTVRAMMAHASRVMMRRQLCGLPTEKTIAYYISSEVDAEKLDANFGEFEWFERVKDPSEGTKDYFKFRIDDPSPDATNFYCITPMLEVDRPVPSPEELVNSIFNRIAHTLIPSEAPAEGAKIYVIIDSITALLKGCEQPGEERRLTHEIMRRLRNRFDKENLALTVLLAEQEHRSQEQAPTMALHGSTQPSVEDYLADIVFRLYTRSMPLGRRARILEVVKSQGANMALGEHTWQIMSHDNVEAILQGKSFQEKIRHQCFESLTGITAPGGSPWGGIIIFPRPRLADKDDKVDRR